MSLLTHVKIHLTDLGKKGDIQVSPVVVAKFLENELKSKEVKHCDSCSCSTKNLIELEGIQTMFSVTTQTEMSTLQCLRCNSNLNSPTHTNSDFLIKLKSSDSVISETKSSVSEVIHNNEKIPFTPTKKDDLMVNPILGHHRLCEHTKTFNYQPMIPKEDEAVKSKEAAKLLNVDGNDLKEKPNVESKNEEKINANQTPLSHGPGNGSNASLWSKTSSKEGAKLFESFNRNLIKTMRVSEETEPRQTSLSNFLFLSD